IDQHAVTDNPDCRGLAEPRGDDVVLDDHIIALCIGENGRMASIVTTLDPHDSVMDSGETIGHGALAAVALLQVANPRGAGTAAWGRDWKELLREPLPTAAHANSVEEGGVNECWIGQGLRADLLEFSRNGTGCPVRQPSRRYRPSVSLRHIKIVPFRRARVDPVQISLTSSTNSRFIRSTLYRLPM